MRLTDPDNASFNKEVQRISQLTNYPQAMVRDIIQADRMYVVDQICDDMQEVGVLPERYSFEINGFGEIRLIRMSDGRTTDAQWQFIPTEEFVSDFFDAFYYGISPIFETMRMNFDEVLRTRRDNLLRSDLLKG